MKFMNPRVMILGPGPNEQEDQAAVQPIDEEVGVHDLNREELNRFRTVHRNLGHPHSTVLVRMLKQSGAAEKFIKAAEKLECEVCKQNAPKKPALPASPNVSRTKWDTVTVDTFWWKHPRKTDKGAERHIVGVSFMDEATDLHVACVVREGEKMLPSVSADEFRKAFSEQWLQHFPKPKNLRFDVEGCFRGNSVMAMARRKHDPTHSNRWRGTMAVRETFQTFGHVETTNDQACQ